MVVVTPAADLQPISEGTDWTFVLDVSGSMGGHKIAVLADGVSRVIGKMAPSDRFRIITFNNSSRDLTGGFISATPDNMQQWLQKLQSIKADGGTNLYAGLERACKRLDDDRTTSIILVTDGVANIGKTEQKEFLNLLDTYDVRLFTFVIGNSANQPLLDRLAGDSGGFAMNICDCDDIVGRIMQAKAKVLHECMHDVQLSFNGEQVKDLTPKNVGNLYIGQQLVMFGRYSGSGQAQLVLRAKISGREQTWTTGVNFPEMDRNNPELERLWALSAIEDAMREIRENGESENLRKQVVDLGLEYSLVTDYTSMLVVHDDILENEGIRKNNAHRIQRERQAQAGKANTPAGQYRVDSSSDSGGMFNGKSSPGLGSGPVGPLFIGLIAWLNRRKKISG
jgi:Ca-activated chloride channel family protein